MWITNHGSGDVAVFDAASRLLARRIPVGSSPHHVTFTPDGTRAYVVVEAGGEVVEIDVASGGIVARTPVGRRPHGIAVATEAAAGRPAPTPRP